MFCDISFISLYFEFILKNLSLILLESMTLSNPLPSKIYGLVLGYVTKYQLSTRSEHFIQISRMLQKIRAIPHNTVSVDTLSSHLLLSSQLNI